MSGLPPAHQEVRANHPGFPAPTIPRLFSALARKLLVCGVYSASRRIDVIVVYKVDRLTRSLADLVELFDAHEVSFVSVTQAFNTTTSMERLTLNVLLSFRAKPTSLMGATRSR